MGKEWFRNSAPDYTGVAPLWAALQSSNAETPVARPDVAFYCVADSDYFLGLVALFNSLRLTGHDEALFVLDRGLRPSQRERLAPHVNVVDDPEDRHPILSKSYAPLLVPAELMVLLDTDIIVTRTLAPLIAGAAEGRVVAFADSINRFVPEWETILGLPPVRRGTYINSGFFAFRRDLAMPVLERLREIQRQVQLRRSRLAHGTPADPFFFPDQDAWNAVLASIVAEEKLWILENRLAPFPPFPGLVLEDLDGLACRYDNGDRPFLLHYISRKPWLSSTRRSVYTKLMTRLLLADDVPFRVRRDEVPWRLRTGLIAEGAVLVAGGSAWAASKRGKLGIRRRFNAALSRFRKSGYSGAQ